MLLREHPGHTLAEIATILGKSTSAVERAAKKLREAGRLRPSAHPKMDTGRSVNEYDPFRTH
ncbi:MAG: winged helix-turn-helix transcriptional regulator [Halothiobacillus sp.]